MVSQEPATGRGGAKGPRAGASASGRLEVRSGVIGRVPSRAFASARKARVDRIALRASRVLAPSRRRPERLVLRRGVRVELARVGRAEGVFAAVLGRAVLVASGGAVPGFVPARGFGALAVLCGPKRDRSAGTLLCRNDGMDLLLGLKASLTLFAIPLIVCSTLMKWCWEKGCADFTCQRQLDGTGPAWLLRALSKRTVDIPVGL